MKQLGNRLRALRESIGISQAKPPVGEGILSLLNLWRCALIRLLR